MIYGRRTKTSELAERLQGELLAERLPAGAPVMSVRELARHFSVSPVTANRVLNLLVENDVLYRIPQSGTFIKYDPPVIPVIAYAGLVPDPMKDDPIKTAAANQLLEHFTELGIEPRFIPFHTLHRRVLAERRLKGANGLLIDVSFIDRDTLGILWDYPGRIVVTGNCYVFEDLACSQVIPDFTDPMIEFNRIYPFSGYDRIIIVRAAHLNARATEKSIRNILARFEVPESGIETVSFDTVGTIQPYLKAFRHFSQYDRLDNTLILSMSEYFSQGIREAFSGKAVMPDILSIDNLEGYVRQTEGKPYFTSIDRQQALIDCKALDLLLRQLEEPDGELPIIRIPARLILRSSVKGPAGQRRSVRTARKKKSLRSTV